MTALPAVVGALRCPLCAGGFDIDGRRLLCSSGHSYDIARQGYVNLTSGRGGPGTGDTTAMVAARAAFLAGGHFAPIADRVGAATRGPLVLDLAGGTGYYLASVLGHLPDALGLCLDLSAAALRRAARVHSRAAAIGADAWQPLPVASGTVSTVLSIFGPRDPDEIERVLGPHGRLLVVAPTPDHLRELVTPLGMIGVDPRKPERQSVAFGRFQLLTSEPLSYSVRLDRTAVAELVGMGPTASHVAADVLGERVATLPAVVDVDIAVDIRTYVRRPADLGCRSALVGRPW
ncbi:MAG: putative RNA methyltransferase [Jatrophihabitans sp.]